ncbi:MAG: PqqD family protein [Desulfurococcales archaeon]|nr:PqqD family protein [Desulfurococcales archaeon]
MASEEPEHLHPSTPEEAKELFDKIKQSKPVRNGNFLGEEKEKFYVAISPNEVYELSPLAYYVWLLCDGEHTLSEIANRMSKELSISIEEVVEPLILALDGLSHVNLVIMKPSIEEKK